MLVIDVCLSKHYQAHTKQAKKREKKRNYMLVIDVCLSCTFKYTLQEAKKKLYYM
jgi:hypothetical protein